MARVKMEWLVTRAHRPLRGLFWSLALGGLFFDLASKYGVFRWLYTPVGEGRVEVIPGVFRLIAQFTSELPASGLRGMLQAWNSPVLPRVNHGALFGVGGDYQIYANSFFALISCLAALAIIVVALRGHVLRDGVLSVTLGLILAGTLGNLFDRVVFGGVRDFLYFYWIEWPVFNVADCFLVAGAGLLVFQAFWHPSPARAGMSVTQPAPAVE